MSGRDPIPNAQAYEGVRAVNPPEMIIAVRNPTASDTKYRLGTFWVNKVNNQTFQLTSVTGGVIKWSNFTSTVFLNLTLGGNLVLDKTGSGIEIKEGADARMGQSTLVSGKVTIPNSSVTAKTRIFISRADLNGSTDIGELKAGSIVPGVSFEIDSYHNNGSLQTHDKSKVNWILFESL